MGGGGSISMTGGTAGVPTTPMGAKDFQQLSDYMQSKHGITLDPSIQKLDFEAAKMGLDGVDAVLNEFPQAAGAIKRIDAKPLNGAYAEAGYQWAADGVKVTKLTMDTSMYGNLDAMSKQIKKDGKYHPPNTDAKAIMAHETGHTLETVLAARTSTDTWQQFLARKKHTEATRIIGTAAKELKKTPEGKTATGKSKTVVDMIHQVSGYASYNRSEALAECVGDYIANGSKASPLSRQVWKHLKAELG